MREVELKGHKVTLYTSIEELPMARFHRYNKYLLIDSAVGGDMSAFDAHIERVVRYIRQDKRDEAATELDNLRQNVYMILEQTTPRYMSFACLVKEVDGKVVDDLSDEGVRKVLEMFSDVPVGELTAQYDAVKKKIDDELTVYFPSIFDDAGTKEFYDLLKERAKAIIDGIAGVEGAEQRCRELTDRLITFSKPRKFTGNESAEVTYDKQYEDMCIIISQNLHTDPKRMTVMEYYNAYQYIERQRKADKRQNKRR